MPNSLSQNEAKLKFVGILEVQCNFLDIQVIDNFLSYKRDAMIYKTRAQHRQKVFHHTCVSQKQ